MISNKNKREGFFCKRSIKWKGSSIIRRKGRALAAALAGGPGHGGGRGKWEKGERAPGSRFPSPIS